MKDIHDQTYYELLELDPSATEEEILKAYNRARATYAHSSPALYSLFNKEEAQELLKLIDEAYSVLSNQFKRKKYDSNKHFNRGIPTQSTQTVSGHASAAPTSTVTQTSKTLTLFGEFTPDPNFEEEIKKTEEFTGPILQKIRLYKNISLDQVSDSIKVSRSYLTALESNNYSSLPAPVFVRGFLVQFAKILGIDPNKVANTYLKLLRESQKK